MGGYERVCTRGEELLTNGVTEPHPLLGTGATPKLVNDDQTGVRQVLKYVIHFAHLGTKIKINGFKLYEEHCGELHSDRTRGKYMYCRLVAVVSTQGQVRMYLFHYEAS